MDLSELFKDVPGEMSNYTATSWREQYAVDDTLMMSALF
jgi:hypothetical protein